MTTKATPIMQNNLERAVEEAIAIAAHLVPHYQGHQQDTAQQFRSEDERIGGWINRAREEIGGTMFLSLGSVLPNGIFRRDT